MNSELEKLQKQLKEIQGKLEALREEKAKLDELIIMIQFVRLF